MRRIASESGFSTAAIYLFFDNKQDLFVQTLRRRGDELIAVLRAHAELDLAPLATLHRIIDTTIVFFTDRPHFARLLVDLRGNFAIGGTASADVAIESNGGFDEAMSLLAGIVAQGQAVGEIRPGGPEALAHLYAVLVNEFVLVAAVTEPSHAQLSTSEFHAVVDGALRAPSDSASQMSSAR